LSETSETSGHGRAAVAVTGALCAVVLVVAILLATAAGGSSGGYSVRAIFDDAANLIPGEDVKIDGVKVGTVDSVTPTPQAKAAVVLAIDNPGFQNFRSDASCTIEPEALIGEKFVNCLPTQPRAPGTPLPPSLHRIPSGHEGEGQYLLPVANTSSPVGVDQLEDINRLPVRERFTIIINELGTGLSGRGPDLNVVIKRADPALRELDRVLGILASQNHVLANLAEESDRALAPVAAVKQQLANFIGASDTVARATANQRTALSQNLAAFPPFLRQLGPAMQRFGSFAEQTLPTFTDLRAAAPGINQMFTSLAPFARSSTAFFQTLGTSVKTTGPALVSLKPLLGQTKTLGAALRPFSGSLAELTTSLRNTGGLERILDFIFLGTGASNGYDALGHFLRAEGVANTCLTYAIKPAPGCPAKLFSTNGTSTNEGSAANATSSGSNGSSGSSAARAASASSPSDLSGTSVVMARTLAVLDGATPAQALARYPGPATTHSAGASGLGTGLGTGTGTGAGTSVAPVGGSSSGTTYYTPSSEPSSAGSMLLNYLLGN